MIWLRQIIYLFLWDGICRFYLSWSAMIAVYKIGNQIVWGLQSTTIGRTSFLLKSLSNIDTPPDAILCNIENQNHKNKFRIYYDKIGNCPYSSLKEGSNNRCLGQDGRKMYLNCMQKPKRQRNWYSSGKARLGPEIEHKRSTNIRLNTAVLSVKQAMWANLIAYICKYVVFTSNRTTWMG